MTKITKQYPEAELSAYINKLSHEWKESTDDERTERLMSKMLKAIGVQQTQNEM